MRKYAPFFMTLLCFTTTLPASATDAPSAERGRELFSAVSLGTNGRSCSVCHPEGSGLEDVTSADDKAVRQTINRCITNALKGNALAPESKDMSSLLMYLRSLATDKPK